MFLPLQINNSKQINTDSVRNNFLRTKVTMLINETILLIEILSIKSSNASLLSKDRTAMAMPKILTE